jgi:regulator of protease activity HflC (stomatin/prohibitin superfamily)
MNSFTLADLTSIVVNLVLIVIAIILLAASFKVVNQATVAVVTMFGKYRRVLRPGLNMLIPFIERINRVVPIQNRTEQLQFKTITNDQAVVYFTATVIFLSLIHI